jgi:hypothetical protein
MFFCSLFLPLLLLLAATGQQLGGSSTGAPVNCSFPDMQSFFTYALDHDLNLTAEVERCQNLCILTYGVGNPDLSGIGVSRTTPSRAFDTNRRIADDVLVLPPRPIHNSPELMKDTDTPSKYP